MSEKATYTKHYVNGSARQIEGTSMVRLSLDLDQLLKAPQNKSKDGSKTYIAFVVGERREVDEYGNSHNVFYSIKDGESGGDNGSSTEDDW